MRIGFLTRKQIHHGIDAALGYGINIALIANTQYAMATAVAIHSVIKHTPCRMSVYVLDCGLSPEDRKKIQYSAAKSQDVTLSFPGLTKETLSSNMGPTWAKLDMIRILPCERVLYLDSDVLVRGRLKELWDFDLKGQVIGAAPDVGYPMGHDGVERRPYFNAGVLLLDLAQARQHIAELESLAKVMEDSKFRDQDVLNTGFRSWTKISLTWNAQGLGTYANIPSSDREHLEIHEMKDPKIIHFTGPVNPSMADVVNPYLQPFTAKPWGYAGAPGHPYQAEWWDTLEETAWCGIRQTKEYQDRCWKDRNDAIKTSIREFEMKLENM